MNAAALAASEYATCTLGASDTDSVICPFVFEICHQNHPSLQPNCSRSSNYFCRRWTLKSPLHGNEIMCLCALLGIKSHSVCLKLFRLLDGSRKVEARSEAGRCGAVGYARREKWYCRRSKRHLYGKQSRTKTYCLKSLYRDCYCVWVVVEVVVMIIRSDFSLPRLHGVHSMWL